MGKVDTVDKNGLIRERQEYLHASEFCFPEELVLSVPHCELLEVVYILLTTLHSLQPLDGFINSIMSLYVACNDMLFSSKLE